MLNRHEHEAECIGCGAVMTCYDCVNRSIDQLCQECEDDINDAGEIA